jgi:hypothetical protein
MQHAVAVDDLVGIVEKHRAGLAAEEAQRLPFLVLVCMAVAR